MENGILFTYEKYMEKDNGGCHECRNGLQFRRLCFT